MKLMVGIPWREQTDRVYAHKIVRKHYESIAPDVDVLDVDTSHDIFCLAACRNAIVRIAESRGADVAIMTDADTLAEQGPLLTAAQAALTSGKVHLPYTEYRSLRRDGTAQHLAGTPLEDCNHLVVPDACSGVYVTTPATWWAHGGQDERHLGWGGEDASWHAAHTTLLGAEPVRHEGRVYALHHEPQVKEGEQYTANFALVYRYHQAEGDPDAMRALISEHTNT